jgi:uncharacterized protein (DUF169 family)
VPQTDLDTGKVAELTEDIKDRVSLASRPIGISLIQREDEIPKKARRPTKRGQTWPLCLGENLVRTMGWTVAMTADDHFCMFAAAGLGHIALPEYLSAGAIGCQHTIGKALGIDFQNSVESIFFEPGSTVGIMLTPATKPMFMPQGILIYGNPTQVGKIAKGVAWYRGEPVHGSAGGFGCCVQGISAAIKEKIPQVIIPSGGEKILGHTEENEVFIACPVGDLPLIVEGMSETDFILPYPTAKYLMFEPQRVPKDYPIDLISRRTYEAWRKGSDV